MIWVDGELLGSRKEVIGDYISKRPVKNILSLGFLDSFSNFIVLISLIFCYLINVRDILKDY